MARGKYSPTVSAAYQANQDWWNAYVNSAVTTIDFSNYGYRQYDPDGFDSYGYNDKDVDRAGNHENDYLHNDLADDGLDGDCNYAYEDATNDWTFDGVKPVRK